MAEINCDAKAVVKVAPKLVAMQNGCICCTLREDLLQQVTELAKEKDADGSRKWAYLLIESTGISEPLPVAQTFVMEVDDEQDDDKNDDQNDGHDRHGENSKMTTSLAEEKKDFEGMDRENEGGGREVQTLKENPLLNFARLDTMVTVVDACSFFDSLTEIQKVKDQPDANGDEDEERTLADLMVDQVEFSNVILLNKCDIMISKNKEKELDAVEELLRRLNPQAIVTRTNHGEISHNKIMNTNLFDMEKAERSAGWIAELEKPSHTPETEEYGVSSFVFRANKPFHPTRLAAIIDEMQDECSIFKGVIRSKGEIWLANALACAFVWHTAGYQFGIEPSSPFLASMLEDALKVPYVGVCSPEKVQNAIEEVYGDDEEALSEIESLRSGGRWSEFGDRKQELVLIGVHLNKHSMREALEKALLTDEEMTAGKKNIETWKSMEDPFFQGNCADLYWNLMEEEN